MALLLWMYVLLAVFHDACFGSLPFCLLPSSTPTQQVSFSAECSCLSECESIAIIHPLQAAPAPVLAPSAGNRSPIMLTSWLAFCLCLHLQAALAHVLTPSLRMWSPHNGVVLLTWRAVPLSRPWPCRQRWLQLRPGPEPALQHCDWLNIQRPEENSDNADRVIRHAGCQQHCYRANTLHNDDSCASTAADCQV
jgi:hypothetical protein